MRSPPPPILSLFISVYERNEKKTPWLQLTVEGEINMEEECGGGTKEEGLKSWRFILSYDVSFVRWMKPYNGASFVRIVVGRTIKISIYFFCSYDFSFDIVFDIMQRSIRKCTKCSVIGDGVTGQGMIRNEGFPK